VTFAIGSIAVLVSSFRSNVFYALGVIVIAGIRDLKIKAVLLIPLAMVCLFSLSFINSELVTLPRQMQRSLAFLPGKWDREMARDAADSNDFRRQVWTAWSRDYFPRHPWIGRGFGFRSEWATAPVLGIIGTVFFVIWNVRMLFQSIKVGFANTGPAGTVLRFLALYLGSSILCYWMGAPSVGTTLPNEFAVAGAFLALRRALASEERLTTPAPEVQQRFTEKLLPV
jgi:hypothetical protein